MAVRVVVEFETDWDAKNFVREMLIEGNASEDVGDFALTGKVVAAYKKPTQFCDPSDGHKQGKSRSWTRGRKYGWWVCGQCGKPTKRWATGDIWHFSMGYNLLPASISSLERGLSSTVEWTEAELGLEKDNG